MRRLASTAIVMATLLLATLAIAPGVSAQAPDEHPAVGAWSSMPHRRTPRTPSSC